MEGLVTMSPSVEAHLAEQQEDHDDYSCIEDLDVYVGEENGEELMKEYEQYPKCTEIASNGTHPQSSNSQSCEESHDARFSCNICLEPASEPVTTHCGHLYCWPCLYRWLEPGIKMEEKARYLGVSFADMDENGTSGVNLLAAAADVVTRPALERTIDRTRRVCPVCRTHCQLGNIVPIYVRVDRAKENKDASDQGEIPVVIDRKKNGKFSNETGSSESTGLRRRNRAMTDIITPENMHINATTTVNPPAIAHNTNPSTRARADTAPEFSSSIPSRPRVRSNFSTHNNHANNINNANINNDSITPPPNNSLHHPVLRNSLFQALLGSTLHNSNNMHSPQRASSHSPSLNNTLHNDNINERVPSIHRDSANLSNSSTTNTDASVHGEQTSTTEDFHGYIPEPSLHNNVNGTATIGTMTSSFHGDDQSHIRPEEFATTDFLSRLLLMLGSFVVLCLLLF